MYKGSIVMLPDGSSDLLRKTSSGEWVELKPTGELFSDKWVMAHKDLKVLHEAEEDLADLALGSVISVADGSVVAVKQDGDLWTMSQDEDWFTTEDMLNKIGPGWKVIYRA